jgi:predicted XRE-type DNA-binding protein
LRGGKRVEAMTVTEDTRTEHGSGNVFADLDRPQAETHLLKAELVARIDQIIRARRLTQAAAELLGNFQPDVSRLLRGNFRDYSLERLLRLATSLGRTVEITIRKLGTRRQDGSGSRRFDREGLPFTEVAAGSAMGNKVGASRASYPPSEVCVSRSGISSQNKQTALAN